MAPPSVARMTVPPSRPAAGPLTRAFAALIARPLWPALVLALVTLLAGWQAAGVRVKVDLGGLIGRESDGAQAIRAYETRFGGLRAEEVLRLHAPSFADAAVLADFEDLLLDLQFVAGTETVVSLASLPAPGREGSWLNGPELAALPPAGRLERMRAGNPLARQLISEDLTTALVVLAPESGEGGSAYAARVVEAARAYPAFDAQLVGLLEVQRSIARELIHDLEALVPAAVGLCLVLALFLFRSARAVLVIAVPPITGLVWFFGWLGATGTAVDPLMGALPVVLIVLAFSDAIHIFHAAQHALDEGGPRRAALARALAETAPAAAMTSLTTLIAFASLALPKSPSMNAMAGAGAAGMVLTLAAVLLLTPVMMALVGVPRAGGRRPRLFARVVPPAQAVAGHPRAVAVAAGLVLVAGLALQSQSREGFRYGDYLPRGAAVTQALAQMEAAGLASDRMLVVVEADPAAPLARVRAAAAAIWGPQGARWTQGDGGARVLARLAAPDGLAHALPVQLPIAAQGARADVALAALEGQLARAGLGEAARVIGPGQALVTEGPRLVSGLRAGLYGTILVITLLVGLVYRSARLALIALVVNLIPILGVEGWLVLGGRELTIMNMIALTVAFGIAVDDTLHFLNRFRLAQGPTPARVRRALAEAGPPMAATTAILLTGLTVTLFSALPGLAVFGGLIATAVALALLADLFLLPGLIRWNVR